MISTIPENALLLSLGRPSIQCRRLRRTGHSGAPPVKPWRADRQVWLADHCLRDGPEPILA